MVSPNLLKSFKAEIRSTLHEQIKALGKASGAIHWFYLIDTLWGALRMNFLKICHVSRYLKEFWFRVLIARFSEIYWRVGCFTAATHPIPLHVPNSFTWDGGDLLHQCHDPSKALIDVKRSVAADAVVLIISWKQTLIFKICSLNLNVIVSNIK